MAIKNILLPSKHIAEDIGAQDFQWLAISPYHAQTVLELEGYHKKDPLDRLLIAQAKYEVIQVVTYDRIFTDYLDDVLLIRK